MIIMLEINDNKTIARLLVENIEMIEFENRISGDLKKTSAISNQ